MITPDQKPRRGASMLYRHNGINHTILVGPSKVSPAWVWRVGEHSGVAPTEQEAFQAAKDWIKYGK